MYVHSWACRATELKLILVLKGACIPLYLVKEPFLGQFQKILTFYLNIFVKNAKLSILKKKANPSFPDFLDRSEKSKQTSFFLGLRIGS